MLTQVPTQINRSARLVTLRHPNALDCTVWKKVIKRTAPTSLGSLPDIGGMGVLDSEDEADFEWQVRGDARIVFAGQFQGQGNNWNDLDTGILYGEPPLEALIECVVEPEAATATSNVPLTDAIPEGGLLIGDVTATEGMRVKLTGQTDTDENGTYTVAFDEDNYTLTTADPFFVAGKPDRITVEPGLGMILHYEIIGDNATVNIAPYTRRYLLASRQDQFAGIG